jgi:hypothetical protein
MMRSAGVRETSLRTNAPLAASALETWPVAIELAVQLRARLPALIRQLADDPVVQGNAMAALLAS